MGFHVGLEKQADEVFSFSVDFSARLGDTEVIASKTVTATDSDGNDVTATIIDDSSYTDDTVTVRIKAGTDGEEYCIQISAVTNSVPANTFLSTIVLEVRDYP